VAAYILGPDPRLRVPAALARVRELRATYTTRQQMDPALTRRLFDYLRAPFHRGTPDDCPPRSVPPRRRGHPAHVHGVGRRSRSQRRELFGRQVLPRLTRG
jgi:hypothetical protein